MVYFTEKLIHEIRDRSCIWDTADMNHLNKEVLANMWTEIAENLYSDWHDLSAFDQRDRVADVKKKWTNIKDSFVKDVKGNKPRKSRGPPEHRKKYYLFDHLQFLIPFIQDTKGTAGGAEPKKKKMRKTVLGESSSRSHGVTVGAPEQVTIKPEMSPDVQQHVDTLNGVAGKSAADAMCQLDGDLSFMVSLLPTVKSLNEKQKINFKIGVLQLLARIKFNEVVMQQQQQQQQHPSADAAAAMYQPFVAPDLRCFPVPYQPSIPFPFINHHHHQAAVSSTQQQQQQQHGVHQTAAASCSSTAGARSMKSSPQTSSFFDTDAEDDGGPGYDTEEDN